jgi:hypothetical protein
MSEEEAAHDATCPCGECEMRAFREDSRQGEVLRRTYETARMSLAQIHGRQYASVGIQELSEENLANLVKGARDLELRRRFRTGEPGRLEEGLIFRQTTSGTPPPLLPPGWKQPAPPLRPDLPGPGDEFVVTGPPGLPTRQDPLKLGPLSIWYQPTNVEKAQGLLCIQFPGLPPNDAAASLVELKSGPGCPVRMLFDQLKAFSQASIFVVPRGQGPLLEAAGIAPTDPSLPDLVEARATPHSKDG